MKPKVLLLVCLLCAASAFGSVVPPTVYMGLISFNGPYVSGIPTYPYRIQFVASVPLYGMCDDYYHGGAPGDFWKAYLNNLSNPNLAYMRFGQQGIVPYQEAGWLLLETFLVPQSEWADINFAVWHIFNSTVPINANAQNWLTLAQQHYKERLYGDVWIATPVQIDAPANTIQEFIFFEDPRTVLLAPTGSVPEPSGLALLGTGALAACVFVRRR